MAVNSEGAGASRTPPSKALSRASCEPPPFVFRTSRGTKDDALGEQKSWQAVEGTGQQIGYLLYN